MIVVALDRTMRLAAADAVERGVERFLGARLADRTGHPDDASPGPCARCAAERFQGGSSVFDKDMRAIYWLRHDRSRGACCKSTRDELVPVMDRPGHCDEQVARLYFAAV